MIFRGLVLAFVRFIVPGGKLGLRIITRVGWRDFWSPKQKIQMYSSSPILKTVDGFEDNSNFTSLLRPFSLRSLEFCAFVGSEPKKFKMLFVLFKGQGFVVACFGRIKT